MKVLNLHCRQDHAFEGWFASEEDFQGQLARGLVECPMCGDAEVTKLPTAPRLNLGAKPQQQQEVMAAPDANLQREWLQVMRRLVAQSEDVGERFAEEARRIHYGEVEERAIRGQASAEQTRELLEEGISVMPVPIALKEPLQ
ncbi:MAG: DUF1178 family protein [Burkholderiales bacterium]|nr:DUF1178 family protein [Burkholderiales bacterium]